jgi:hypothetical protein
MLVRSGPCLLWVKLRNIQHEQMSSALLPRTDVGLARPKELRGFEGHKIWNFNPFADRLDLETECAITLPAMFDQKKREAHSTHAGAMVALKKGGSLSPRLQLKVHDN